MRRLMLVAVAAAALGFNAPGASAKCSPDADPLVCFVNCTVARLAGAWCKQ